MNFAKPALAIVAAALLTLGPTVPASALDLQPAVTIGAGSFPHVSIDPATGTTLLVWMEDPGTINGQILDENLNVLVPTFALSSDTSQVEWSQPFAEWNPDASNWLVVWENDSQVYARIVDPTTGATGTVSLLATYAEANTAWV